MLPNNQGVPAERERELLKLLSFISWEQYAQKLRRDTDDGPVNQAVQ